MSAITDVVLSSVGSWSVGGGGSFVIFFFENKNNLFVTNLITPISLKLLNTIDYLITSA